jgi:hypothetical protein
MNKLDRDYIWECDYGERTKLKKLLRELLLEQDATSLQMIQLFTNSNPYCLELYVVVSYDKPKEGHINKMMEGFKSLGVRYRPDITVDELWREMKNRRFNTITLDDFFIDTVFMAGGNLFLIAEKSVFKENGYIIEPLGSKTRIFLSHSSKNKEDIEAFIPYLNAKQLPVWYAPLSIEYGDSIVNKVQEGMNNSVGVIFWITKDFIESNWCKKEMNTFLNRHIVKENVLILSIVDSSIDEEELPPFISELKYIKMETPIKFEYLAKEVIPVLEKVTKRTKEY